MMLNPRQKRTYALRIKGESAKAFMNAAQEFANKNLSEDIKIQEYMLGLPDVPHVNLFEIAATEHEWKQSRNHLQAIMRKNPAIMPRSLTLNGMHILPIHDPSTFEQEPDMQRDSDAQKQEPRQLSWWCIDYLYLPHDLFFLQLACQKTFFPKTDMYDICNLNYRPHTTLMRLVSNVGGNFNSVDFNLPTLRRDEDFELIAADASPSGMLFLARITHVFNCEQMCWQHYSLHGTQDEEPEVLHSCSSPFSVTPTLLQNPRQERQVEHPPAESVTLDAEEKPYRQSDVKKARPS